MSVTPTVFTSSWKNLFKNLHRSLSFEITLSLSTRVILFIVVPLSNKKCFILWLFYVLLYIICLVLSCYSTSLLLSHTIYYKNYFVSRVIANFLLRKFKSTYLLTEIFL